MNIGVPFIQTRQLAMVKEANTRTVRRFRGRVSPPSSTRALAQLSKSIKSADDLSIVRLRCELLVWGYNSESVEPIPILPPFEDLPDENRGVFN